MNGAACVEAACLVIVATSWKSDCLMDPSDKRVFHPTKSYPMEKKWRRHDKQGLIQSEMCASGVLGDCGKVRLSDGSDGSIGQTCFPSNKELSDREKMTSWQAGFNSIRDVRKRRAWWLWQSQIVRWIRWIHRTSVFFVGQRILGLKNWRNNSCGCIGNLTSYGIDQSICSNSKLSLLKSEVSLRFLLIAKFLDNDSCFFKTVKFLGCEYFGSFLYLLSGCF